MIKRNTMTRATILAFAALWLSACTILPKSEPLSVYQLPAPQMQPSAAGQSLPTLRINTPRTGFALSTPRMLVKPDGNRVSSYKGARWTDPVPVVLREHLAKAFTQQGSPARVSTDEHALHADVHLGSDLQQFQVRYDGLQPVAVIELDARLVNPNSREVLAARRFLVEQPLDNPQAPGVVVALKLAADELAEQLIQWTADSLKGYEAK
ncbi:MAG: membrane integrity-associated transporter subunit PqiC [Pseudomonas sp.]|uniref:ABC-type transport auxiliary lipoprotein family protein n=1 Tax=Halopseudomonas TaxID=2901189 RepID=UPI001B64C7C5|nr:membrane integrity-associated transporter subunit PqiC [Pseudomonas sp.]MBQ0779074.1 membrane integrity-associated transporter subunit PqiC [Pseudomonas sp.]